MPTPLDMPNRSAVTQTRRPAYRTDSATVRRDAAILASAAGQAALARAAEAARAAYLRNFTCPGSDGEISSGACRQIYGDRCSCW